MASEKTDPGDDEKRRLVVEKMMEKFGLKGKRGRVFVEAVIDKVGLEQVKVENWILRAKISSRT
ncbi:MAG: hypothetical protein ACTSU5_06135 [Promethearchaeota archaeon]